MLPLGGVLHKIGSATVLKPIKEYLRRSLIFHETTSEVFFIDFEHRCSFILCRLAILKNTYSNIFAERLRWLLLIITSILLIGSIQSFTEL